MGERKSDSNCNSFFFQGLDILLRAWPPHVQTEFPQYYFAGSPLLYPELSTAQDNCDRFKDKQQTRAFSSLLYQERIGAARPFSNADTVLYRQVWQCKISVSYEVYRDSESK